jgi:hypothetical protein
MQKMMVSRYQHDEFDSDLLMPSNRAAIINMLGRKEQLDYFC